MSKFNKTISELTQLLAGAGCDEDTAGQFISYVQTLITEARVDVASNAMAIALCWVEEDGRPKHLMQDLWDVMDISVLDHIDGKYIKEGKDHFAQLKENK